MPALRGSRSRALALWKLPPLKASSPLTLNDSIVPPIWSVALAFQLSASLVLRVFGSMYEGR